MQAVDIRPGPMPDPGTLVWGLTVYSRVDFKYPLIDQLVVRLRGLGWIPLEDEHWLTLCLDEVLVNAMLHGNEGDPLLPVTLRLWDADASWALSVEDQGDGFTPGDVPDPDDEDNLMFEHGRGIVIMLQWLDKLVYYEGGSCALLQRHKESGEDAS